MTFTTLLFARWRGNFMGPAMVLCVRPDDVIINFDLRLRFSGLVLDFIIANDIRFCYKSAASRRNKNKHSSHMHPVGITRNFEFVFETTPRCVDQ